MATNILREFFHEKRAADARRNDNWPAKKDAWKKAIKDFYNLILGYLNPAITENEVKVGWQEKQIAEDYVGSYVVKEMVLQVGNEKVVFSPKGMNIVGATGRIDLRGDMGEVTIIRHSGDRWGVVATRVPTLKIIPLNEESLLEALRRVMRQ